jgi:uncharacterized protein (TIGR00369 family)
MSDTSVERAAAKVRDLSGIDALQAVIDGVLPTPPLEKQLRFRFAEVAAGRIVVTWTPQESAYNGFATVHGGLLCALLDVVSGSALHSTLPRGKGYTSVEIKVTYLRPVRASSGMLTATGTVVRAGSRVGFTEGVIVDNSGKPVATSTSSLLIFDV